MRYPGITLAPGETPSPALLQFIAWQLSVAPAHWTEYGQLRLLTVADYRQAVQALVDLALQTDNGIVLDQALLDYLRRRTMLAPAPNLIERICAEAITRATRRIYDVLTRVRIRASYAYLGARV